MIHQIRTLSLLRSTRHLNFGIPSAFVIRISSFLNLPRFGARQSLCPAGAELFSRGGFHGGDKKTIHPPLGGGFPPVFSKNYAPTRQAGRAAGRPFPKPGRAGPHTRDRRLDTA